MIISSSSSVTEPSKTIRISSVTSDTNGNGMVTQKSGSSVFARLGGKQNDDENYDDDDDDVVIKNTEMFSGIFKKAPIKVKPRFFHLSRSNIVKRMFSF